MAEIHCVCGRTIPVPADTKERLLRCPSCDASHDLKPTSIGRRTLLVGLILATLLAVGWLVRQLTRPQTQSEPEVQPTSNDLQIAKEMFDRGDLRGAESKLKKILALDPNAWDALVFLGRLYQAMGWHEAAEPPLAQAHKAKPEDVDVRIRLAESLLLLNRPGPAADLVERIHEDSPSPRTALILADAYTELDRLPDAEEVCRWLVGVTPQDVRSAKYLLRTLLLLGNLDAAEKFVASVPAGYGAVVLQVDLFREKGDLSGAISKIEEGLKDPSRSVDLSRLRIQMLFEAGRFEEVVPAASELMKKASQDMILLDVGFVKSQALLLLKKREEAVEDAKRVLAVVQRSSQMTILRDKTDALLLLVGRKRKEEVVKGLERLPRRAHNDHYLYLACLSWADGKEGEYRRDLEAARKSTVGRNYPHFLIEFLLKR